MIRVPIDELTAGTRLARTIFSGDGKVLLARGMVLNQGFIAKLKERGFQCVYTFDDRTSDVEFQEVVSEELRVKVSGQVRQVFQSASKGGAIDLSGIKQSVDQLIDEVLQNRHIVYSLTEVRAHDGYTFAHSVNVCVLSTLLGSVLGLSRSDLHDLAVGAILHDIGKVFVAAEVLDKDGRLTLDEMEEIKRHPRYGYEFLRSEHGVSLRSAHVALQHHERLNGSGYPRGLRGEEIHPFARIVMVVDTFDAMTSHRPYRRSIPSHAALSLIGRMSGRQFPIDVVRTLQRHVAPYPVGCRVRLDTGEVGVVTDVDRKDPERPTVRILQDAKGAFVVDPVQIDLSRDTRRIVTEVF